MHPFYDMWNLAYLQLITVPGWIGVRSVNMLLAPEQRNDASVTLKAAMTREHLKDALVSISILHKKTTTRT